MPTNGRIATWRWYKRSERRHLNASLKQLAESIGVVAFANDGIYPASVARPIPLRPKDLERAFRQGD